MASHGNNLFLHQGEEEDVLPLVACTICLARISPRGMWTILSWMERPGVCVYNRNVEYVLSSLDRIPVTSRYGRIAPSVVEMTPHIPSASCIPAGPSIVPQPPFSLGSSSKWRPNFSLTPSNNLIICFAASAPDFFFKSRYVVMVWRWRDTSPVPRCSPRGCIYCFQRHNRQISIRIQLCTCKHPLSQTQG